MKRIRPIALALPGVIEKPSHGSPTFFTGEGRQGRTFASVHDEREHFEGRLCLWAAGPKELQEALVDGDPSATSCRPTSVPRAGSGCASTCRDRLGRGRRRDRGRARLRRRALSGSAACPPRGGARAPGSRVTPNSAPRRGAPAGFFPALVELRDPPLEVLVALGRAGARPPGSTRQRDRRARPRASRIAFSAFSICCSSVAPPFAAAFFDGPAGFGFPPRPGGPGAVAGRSPAAPLPSSPRALVPGPLIGGPAGWWLCSCRPRSRSCGCRPPRAGPGHGRSGSPRPRSSRQRVLERLAALEVEMVGRLVEDQHVGAGGDEDRQREAALLAAGDVGELLVDVGDR